MQGNYDRELEFNSNIKIVVINGLYGTARCSGEEIIRPRYPLIWRVDESRAIAMADGKYGLIDKSGNLVTPLKYDTIDFDSNDVMRVTIEDKYGLIAADGTEIITPDEYDYIGCFNDGLAAIQLGDQWGYIDKRGSIVIPLKYNWASYFCEGRAIILDRKCGVIDTLGREITPAIYDDIDDYCWGMAQIEKDGRFGLIDKNGREVIPPIYADVGWDSCAFDGECALVWDGKYYGLINGQGQEIVPLKYNYIDYFGNDGWAEIQQGNKYGYINRLGEEVIPPIYDAVNRACNGMIQVSLNKRIGLANSSGDICWCDPTKGDYQKINKWEYVNAVLKNKE